MPDHFTVHQLFLKSLGLPSGSQEIYFQDNAIYGHEKVGSFIDNLKSIGAKDKIIYLENGHSESEFLELIKKADYPLLVFLDYQGKVTPHFFQREAKAWKVMVINDDGTVEQVYTGWEKLPEALFRRSVSPGQEKVAVVTAFPDQSFYHTGENQTNGGNSRFKMFSKLMELLAPERKEIMYILMYALFVGLISLSLPLGVQSLVGFISSGQVVTSSVVLILFILLGIVLSGVMTIYQLELVEYLQQKLFARTAFAFAFRIPRLRFESMLKYYPPELMNRFFDTLTLQKGIPVLLIDLSAAILQVLLGVVLLSLYHPLFILLGSLLIVSLIIVLRLTGPKGLNTALLESDHKYKLANWLEEMARSLSTFKLAGNTGLAMEKTDYHVSNYIRARESHFKILKFQYYSFVVFKGLITAFLLIIGMVLIVDRQINLGQFVAAEIVIILIMNSVEKIIMKVDDVYDVLAGVEKITKVTSLPVEKDGIFSLPVTSDQGLQLSLRNINYQYPDRDTPALCQLHMEVSAGEHVGIAGSNGSGKSTLINLLLGLYDSYTGTITYNGVSLREIRRADLMNHIGNYVTQDQLFDGTVLENITIGRRAAKMNDVFWAVEAVGLTEYINSLPSGFQTRLVGGEVRLPDTVVQKLIMARNIVERPSLLILDDFLLGVERSEKKRILDLILSQNYHWTVILVSNDPMVLSGCARVLFMQNGRVADQGDMSTLANRNEDFNKLIRFQS